jgi:hypothetical protein
MMMMMITARRHKNENVMDPYGIFLEIQKLELLRLRESPAPVFNTYNVMLSVKCTR